MSSSSVAPVVLNHPTQRTWSQYVENGCLDGQIVRPEVANSWRRSRNFHVDPFRMPAGEIGGLDLKEHTYNARHLIQTARPVMENLFAFLRGSGFQMVLTDASGVVLETLGDRETLDRTRRLFLYPGVVWSEQVRGTNAIGLAIAEKRPVQVDAWEHYCEPHHSLTCSASPIFAPDGSMIGALDISGDQKAANSHTLGMAAAAANLIESRMKLQNADRQLEMAQRYSSILLKNISDGLITLDSNGIITEINARGAEIFGVVPYRVKGQHIGRIAHARELILPTFAGGALNENREFVLNLAGHEIQCSSSPMQEGSGETAGTVVVLREVAKRPARQKADAPSARYTFDDIVSECEQMAAIKKWARVAAGSPFTVLLRGETGTGKEYFAQAIHNGSSRHGAPFIAINCAALPESLIESELFGYEEGSFTGARKGGHAGKFAAADGGTIFLDEIGDMPLAAQTRLLRVIQEGKVMKVGSDRETCVDVRIIAATHKDLESEVKQGSFRKDLYYRLNVLEVKIPSLRERAEDIPELARQLSQRITHRYSRTMIEIDDDFLSRMQRYTWPGNVREMENVLERAILRSGSSGRLSADLLDFPGEIAAELKPLPEPELGQDQEQMPEVPVFTGSLLRDAEREQIHRTLVSCKGNIRKAAETLGIGRNTLYRKMKEYDICRILNILDIS